MQEKFKVREFILNEVMEECNSLKTIEAQIEYLNYVLKEYLINPPRLDPNGEINPTFKERMEIEIEYREKELLLRKQDVTSNIKTSSNPKIQIPENDGLTDLIRIFTSMKNAEIIDKQTSITNIARIFCETENEVKEFASKYYASEKNTRDYKRNSNSKKLFEFICDLIENAYDKKPDKIDELHDFLDQLRKDSYKN